MAADDTSQTTPVQITQVPLLFYTNCAYAILIPVRVLLLIGIGVH